MDNASLDIEICRQCQHKDCRYCRFNPNSFNPNSFNPNSFNPNGPALAGTQPTVRTRFPDNELLGHEIGSVIVQNNSNNEGSGFKQFVRTEPCGGFEVDYGAADIQRAVDAIEKAGFVVVHKSDPTLRIIDKMYGTDYGQKRQPQD